MARAKPKRKPTKQPTKHAAERATTKVAKRAMTKAANAAKAAKATKATTAKATKATATKATKAPRVSTHPPKQRTPESRTLIEKIRTTCLALPDTTEQIAWGEPTWRVGGRLFAQFDDHHHGGAHVSVWLPAPDGAQAALIDAEPDHLWRPPYVGHLGWIAVKLDTDPPWGMVENLVEQAHALIAAKRKPKRRPT